MSDLMARSITVEIPGKPVPCSRPRVTRFGTYYNPAYEEWKQNAMVLIRDAVVKQNGGRLLVGPLRVSLEFHGAHGSADIDNLVKGALDAAQKQAFKDDVAVHELSARKTKDKPACTRMEIEVIE